MDKLDKRINCLQGRQSLTLPRAKRSPLCFIHVVRRLLVAKQLVRLSHLIGRLRLFVLRLQSALFLAPPYFLAPSVRKERPRHGLDLCSSSKCPGQSKQANIARKTQ